MKKKKKNSYRVIRFAASSNTSGSTGMGMLRFSAPPPYLIERLVNEAGWISLQMRERSRKKVWKQEKSRTSMMTGLRSLPAQTTCAAYDATCWLRLESEATVYNGFILGTQFCYFNNFIRIFPTNDQQFNGGKQNIVRLLAQRHALNRAWEGL